MKITIKIWLSILVFIALFACTKRSGGATADRAEITVRFGAASIDDKSFNASAWRGITHFYGDTPENPSKRGIYYDYILASNKTDYMAHLRLMAEGGHDLVIVAGFAWAASLSKVAPDYPEQKFLIVDVAGLPNKAQNIMEVVYAEEQGSFLVGIAAALKAKEVGLIPKFGFIGGMPEAVITRFQVGYMQGILSVLPEAEIWDYYANSWVEPAKAKAKANDWYNDGVYVIFSAAGFTGSGTIQMAKERRRRGEDVWAIGVDSDQYEEGIYEVGESAILTSMIKHVDAATELALSNIKAGTFKAEILRLDLKTGGVGFSERNPNLSAGILAEIRNYEQKVINGEIVLDKTVAEFTSFGHLGEGLTLLAQDD